MLSDCGVQIMGNLTVFTLLLECASMKESLRKSCGLCGRGERGKEQTATSGKHAHILVTNQGSFQMLAAREHLITTHTDDTDLTPWAGWETPFQIGP